MTRNSFALATLALALCSTSSSASAQDPFASIIRPTEPLTPEQELASFHVPPGFEVQLVASEPGIQKPMNLAFDARGRLWMSGSTEYPYAAPLDRPGRDCIKVLEDRDGDGRAEQITTFADGLNIPIGLYPYKNGAIAFSIPYIYSFQDSDGDGLADQRERLYGPLGYQKDTHGLNNAFRRGFDGWLYACHGFNNDTTIEGRDGSRIELHSGNTYRVRLDGGRAEQFTWGQVNPFGMTFDPLGDLYNADCHTKPITLLLQGGYYESFGKPHDGLGFVPAVMQHLHGSTAIAGVTQYTGDAFPPEYRGSMFTGNVMTSRVHRDTLIYRGSSVEAHEEADFLVSDDPWFRPVDLQVGPDGALYVADFYNRVIGHYEVALDDPGRDRFRGRIWRVVYVGDGSKPAMSRTTNLRQAGTAELIASFDHANLGVRMRATDELVDRIGDAAVSDLAKALKKGSSPAKVQALWALQRLERLSDEQLAALATSEDGTVRIHVQRVLAESSTLSAKLSDFVARGLVDADPLVRRAAADAAGRHPRLENVGPLVDLLEQTPAEDVHLRYAARMALRDQLRKPGLLTAWQKTAGRPQEFAAIAGVILAVPTEEAGAFVAEYVRRVEVPAGALPDLLAHAARYSPLSAVDALAEFAREKLGDDMDRQAELWQSLAQASQQRGVELSSAMKAWGGELAERLLDSIEPASLEWQTVAQEGANGTPWGLERRNSADGEQGTWFLSSLPGGERTTGVLRSRRFAIPARLRFFLCGHLGFPNDPPSPRNLVRLCLASDGRTVAEALAPRNDVAQPIDWDLAEHAGADGYLEIVDGLDLDAYAWVAAARFEPAVVSVPKYGLNLVSGRQQAAAAIARTTQPQALRSRFVQLVRDEGADAAARLAAAWALLAYEPDRLLDTLAALISEPAVAAPLRTRICGAVADRRSEAADKLLEEAMRTAPERVQASLAQGLAESPAGAEALLALVAQGRAAPRLLTNRNLRQRLLASGPADAAERIDQLTASLPPLNLELRALQAERARGYASAAVAPDQGAALFKKHCAACHQIGGQGTVIGPQLDGVGNRGLERLLEDLLDPSRNVDAAFQTTLYTLADGRIVTGLFRRKEGATLVVADNKGQEVIVAEDQIEEQTRSKLSLMPDNVGTLLTAAEFYDLAAYLLAQRQAAPKPE